MAAPLTSQGRLARLAYGAPDFAGPPGACAHAYVAMKDASGKTVWVCVKPGCGHTKR